MEGTSAVASITLWTHVGGFEMQMYLEGGGRAEPRIPLLCVVDWNHGLPSITHKQNG